MDRSSEPRETEGQGASEPGEPRRTLDRAPGERYLEQGRRSGRGAGGEGSQLARGVGVALVGALVIAFIGGPMSVTAGLLVPAVFFGWLVALVVRPAVWIAVGLSVGSVALGLVGIWLFAGLEGGSLGLIDYLGEVHGWLAPILLAAAALVAVATIR